MQSVLRDGAAVMPPGRSSVWHLVSLYRNHFMPGKKFQSALLRLQNKCLAYLEQFTGQEAAEKVDYFINFLSDCLIKGFHQ